MEQNSGPQNNQVTAAPEAPASPLPPTPVQPAAVPVTPPAQVIYVQPPAPQKTNGMAIASLVLGLLGWFYLIPAILALVFGFSAKKQIDASGGTQGGRGMAVAGVVLGWVFLGLFALVVVITTTSHP